MMRRKHRYLLYEVTKRCQNSCVFCYNVWKETADYPQGELSTEDSLRMLDSVFQATGCEFIGLTGGEPLLRDDIFEIASFIASRKVLPVLISNGRLLTRETVARCMDSGVSYFEVSLHPHQPAVHDALKAADMLAAEKKASVEVVDIRSLVPLDE